MTEQKMQGNAARLRRWYGDRQYVEIEPARLGRLASGGGIDPDITAGIGLLWVRPGINGDRAETAAINAGVNQAFPDAPVLVGKRGVNGPLCVFDADFNEETASAYGAALIAAATPVISTASDNQPKDAKLLTPGRVSPSMINPGTLYVRIAPFWNNGRWLGGLEYDVGSGNLPGTTGQYRWAVVYLDENNTAYTAVGTAVGIASKDLLTLDSASEIDIPAGHFVVGLLTLANAQTDIAASRFEDPRDWITPRGSLLSGSAEVVTIASGVATLGNGGNFTLAAESGTTDSVTSFVVTGAPRLLVLRADSGDTITIENGTAVDFNSSTDFSVTGTAEVMLYWNGTAVVDVSPNPLGSGAGLPSGAEQRTVLHEEMLGSSDNFDISSITSGYTHLLIRGRWRSTVSAVGDVPYIFFNGDTTTTNYRSLVSYNINTTPTVQASNDPRMGICTGDTSPTDAYGEFILEILGYAGSAIKTVATRFWHYRSTSPEVVNGSGMVIWNSTNAINQITIQPDGYSTDSFTAGSYIEIIGLRTVP